MSEKTRHLRDMYFGDVMEITPDDAYVGCTFVDVEFTGYGGAFWDCTFRCVVVDECFVPPGAFVSESCRWEIVQ